VAEQRYAQEGATCESACMTSQLHAIGYAFRLHARSTTLGRPARRLTAGEESSVPDQLGRLQLIQLVLQRDVL
jgi:hypothetical protein